MKIDFNYKFTELDGTIIPERPPIMEKDDKGETKEKKFPPFTLRKMCTDVLMGLRMKQIKCPKCGNELDQPEILTGEQKLERYDLAMRIQKSTGLLDLGTKEIEFLKKLIGIVYPQMTSGQAWQILDPHSVGEKK